MSQRKVILSGGGTGGHVYPAIAIANAIKAIAPDTQFLFVGAEGRMEMEKVPDAGYDIIGLKVVGFQRRFTLENLTFPFKLISSLWRAKSIVKGFNPDIVIGTGGYASGPILRVAASRKIPTVIQEQNSYPGVTNRLLAKKAKKICVAYKNMDKYFPADKIILTGNPIRKDICNLEGKKEEALKYFGLNAYQPILLILGGSLGSATINSSVINHLSKLTDEGIQVIWQTGKNYFHKINGIVSEDQKITVKILPFLEKMDLAYAAASVIISRAGASSVSELSVVGKPCILVPSPNVSEDHQTKNAMALVSEGAAILVKDIDAPENLVDKAIEIFKSESQINQLSSKIKEFAKANAAEVIAKEVLRIIEEKK
jgi:UDP-N-acetylglucosamine--N-acetylmuramyl-(pentapeptide) pyrophosphoryl-undecaprenol N-acetylglucosamine transferase